MSAITIVLAALQVVPPDTSGGASSGLLGNINFLSGLRAFIMVAVGLPLALAVSRWVRKWATDQVNPQAGLITGKLVFYLATATLVVSTMTELGFSLTPLLGAAGVVGIALGFASQTSVSNVIAGLFLIAESPFVVDDLIQVGDVTGRVLSVDTMSVKLRTLDNKFVRIPNDVLVKSIVTNVTRFPIRRIDIRVGIAYKESPDRARAVLLDVAEKNPLALMEPEPIVVFEGFGDSSLNLLFAVWTSKENWLALKNSVQEEVKAAFDTEGIEIPFPHRTLYAGSESEAFPVRVVQDEPAGDGGPPESL